MASVRRSGADCGVRYISMGKRHLEIQWFISTNHSRKKFHVIRSMICLLAFEVDHEIFAAQDIDALIGRSLRMESIPWMNVITVALSMSLSQRSDDTTTRGSGAL